MENAIIILIQILKVCIISTAIIFVTTIAFTLIEAFIENIKRNRLRDKNLKEAKELFDKLILNLDNEEKED